MRCTKERDELAKHRVVAEQLVRLLRIPAHLRPGTEAFGKAAGEWRIWSLLGPSDISVRTGGRIMALNKLVYEDLPDVPQTGVKKAPGLHPYKARYRHQ